jgi:hypothetical protein
MGAFSFDRLNLIGNSILLKPACALSRQKFGTQAGTED